VADVYETVILMEFEDIREQLAANEDEILNYLEYVERTWVGRRLGGRTRKTALFPIPSWNHHNTFLTGQSLSFIIPLFNTTLDYFLPGFFLIQTMCLP
jgi:hypothetical protein